MLRLNLCKDLLLRCPVWIAPSDHVLKVCDETALQSRTGDRQGLSSITTLTASPRKGALSDDAHHSRR